MATPHHDHIGTAFLQLSFAIKLWNFLDEHPIDKEQFDIDLTIEDPGNCICLNANEFKTYEDLQLAAENNISIAFGAAALTLWEAIRERSNLDPKKLKPKDDAKQNVAALIYMLRCCFAHGTVVPTWNILTEKYKIKYCVGNKVIDLSQVLNHTPFVYESIGGYETLWLLRVSAQENGLL